MNSEELVRAALTVGMIIVAEVRNNPIATGATNRLTATRQSGQIFSKLSIYPNPANSHQTELRIAGFEGTKLPVITEVEIIKLTGEIVFADRISCGGDCASYLIQVNERLIPGLYMVNMETDGLRFSERLLVK